MGQVITASLLRNLYVAFQTSFQNGFAGVTPTWSQIATRVPSSTKENEYGWLGAWPKIREWIGDRQVNELQASTYTLKNKRFETTVAVNRDDIEDDNLGIYAPMMTELGRAVAIFPDELIYSLLAAGFATECYDGQYFFDTDHPAMDGDGVVSNFQGGAGTPWFLMDVSRSLKPLIWQDREAFNFTALDRDTDPNVFMKNEYLYGSTGRGNAGFGFWQMAFASKEDLTADSYEDARAQMASWTDESGRKLGVEGTLLVVPSTLEGAGRRLLKSELRAAGGVAITNEWAGSADLLVSKQL